MTTIDDILHPNESRRVEMAHLDWQIKFLNHALKALESPAATLGNDDNGDGLEEGQTTQAGLQPEPLCEDCHGTGVRDRNIEGCDVEARCWCEHGDL